MSRIIKIHASLLDRACEQFVQLRGQELTPEWLAARQAMRAHGEALRLALAAEKEAR